MSSLLRRASRARATLALLLAAPLLTMPAPAPAATQAETRDGNLGSDSLERLAELATRAVTLINVETPTGSRQGSGFLVDPNGVILTNYHVLRDARRARVKLSSGDVYDRVTILATDERRDIAVLRIDGYGLPTLPLGNSDSVRVGAPAIAIGSPLGLQNTVSTGIVSGRRQEPEGYHRLQLTAPTSPGSSGGPVLSLRGEVIGISVSQMRDGQNLNFAVPINYARGLLAHIGGEPVAVLEPRPAAQTAAGVATGAKDVNRGLPFDLSRFAGYSVDIQGPSGKNRWRRTRVSYRRIETVGGGPPRIERYADSEMTQEGGPFGTPQAVRRERSRTLVFADGLLPVSARGEIAWWTEGGWRTTTYDLVFQGYHVRGTIVDTTGSRKEVDQELPPGVVLREMGDLAFASLAADSLIGRSVELVTFDPRSAEMATDRYDVRDTATVEGTGRSHRALRVEVASGLSNSTAFFDLRPPHVVLRRETEDGVELADVSGEAPNREAAEADSAEGAGGPEPATDDPARGAVDPDARTPDAAGDATDPE